MKKKTKVSKANTTKLGHPIVDSFEKLLADSTMPKLFTKGEVIEGIVVRSNENEMILNVGGRSEGLVAGKELKLDGAKVVKKPGDKLMVYVIDPMNSEGQVELSVRKTGDEIKWHELNEAKEKDLTIKVKVIEANTGGVIVEIGGGLRGFVPSSHLKNSRIYTTMEYDNKEDATKKLQSKLAQMIDEELEVKVMEINRDINRVILSEKWVYNEADLEQRNQTLEKLKVGDILEGSVTGIAPFGLFVNAGGVEGLVHLSQISWDKVSNPADYFKINDVVRVQVIGLNDGGKKVAYSIKSLISDPWKDIVKKYKVGEVVEGVISSIADYGAFVKIEEGLNGLIHISELSHKLVEDPRNIVKEGDKVKVMIISISNDDRHLGLSLKRLQEPAKKEEKLDEPEVVKTPASTEAREMEGLEKLIKDAEE